MRSETRAKIELIDHIDKEITNFIRANKGAKTKDDVLAVFNSTLLLIHEIRSDLYYDAQTEQSHTQTKIMNILGGIR